MCFKISSHKHKSKFLQRRKSARDKDKNEDTLGLGLKNYYSAIWRIQFPLNFEKVLLLNLSEPITLYTGPALVPAHLHGVARLRRGPLEGEHHLECTRAAGQLAGTHRPQGRVRVYLVSQHRGPEHLQIREIIYRFLAKSYQLFLVT